MEKDPAHWLYRLDPREWIRASLGELRRAEEAYRANDARAGLAGARRAAGMALNAALIHEPDERWGRSFMDHLAAVQRSADVPEAVSEAALLLLSTPAPGGSLLGLRSKAGDERLLEAARTVMAHAYAVVVNHEGDITEPVPESLPAPRGPQDTVQDEAPPSGDLGARGVSP